MCSVQSLTFFADVSGVAFSPDSSTLMLALNDVNGGLAEFITGLSVRSANSRMADSDEEMGIQERPCAPMNAQASE